MYSTIVEVKYVGKRGKVISVAVVVMEVMVADMTQVHSLVHA